MSIEEHVALARSDWFKARERLRKAEDEIFPMGGGYGDPDALRSAEHQLTAARREAEDSYRVYQDLENQRIQEMMLRFEKSQTHATWASVAIAFALAVATFVNIGVAILKRLQSCRRMEQVTVRICHPCDRTEVLPMYPTIQNGPPRT